MERKKQLTKIAAFTVIALVVLINAQSESEKGSVTVIGYDENNNQVTSTFLIHLHPTDNPTDSSFIQAQEGVGIYSDVDPGEYFIWAGGVAYHKSWQGKDCPFTINAGQHITKKIMFYPGTGTINCAYYPGTPTT